MKILKGDWTPERFTQSAFRYEVLRRIPPGLYARIWIHTLNHSTLDEVIDRIGLAMEAVPERLLSEIVDDVLVGRAMIDDSTTPNEPPMIVDVVDEYVINQWFDHWSRQYAGREKRKTVERIRRLALAGNRKAKRNNKAIAAVLADVFDGMAEDARRGKLVVRTFPKRQ